ncbi:MAG: methyltransferase family protein [Candidatus Izemoplasmataceae bacterium]
MNLEVFFKLEWSYILFYLITVLWILEFIVFRPKFKNTLNQETKTFKQILFTIIFVIFFTNLLTLFDLYRFEASTLTISHYLGIGLYSIGILLRYIASITLGEYFTRDVSVSKDMNLKSKGVYKYLRHPLYLGLFLLVIAVPLFFGNYFMMLTAILLMGKLINHRMIIEEMMLEKALGESYLTWKKARYRFIPFIY